MKKIVLLLPFLIFLSQASICQVDPTRFKFDLSVRYRFELWDGMNAKNYGDDSEDAFGDLNDKILLQRIIPGITYSGSKISAAFHIQDSRAFGWSLQRKNYPDLYNICQDETMSPYYTMNPQEEYFEIYDLYFEYRELFKNVTVKVGRQKIFYGDYRIFEPSLWGNTGRWTWDAVKFSYKKGETCVDIFGGGTKIHNPLKTSIPFTNTEFWGGGLYSHFRLTEWLNAEPFYALKTQGSAKYIKNLQINRNWIGLRLASPEHQHLIYDLLYAYEFGSEDGKRIDAFGYIVKAGYRVASLPAHPTLNFRYNYASGGKESDNMIHTFDPAYGARAKFYGWMSIAHWSNISFPEFALELSPLRENMQIEIKYSRFRIPETEDCLMINTMKLKEGKNFLGDELDIFVRYQPSGRWQYTGIVGYFNPGDLENINSRPPKDALCLTFQVLFTLGD